MGRDINEISGMVVGACIEVHRWLGPGLLERAYEEALGDELTLLGLGFARQSTVRAIYKGRELNAHYRADLIVEEQVVVELKAVEQILPIHRAQALTYLRLSPLTVALLVNFNYRTC